MRLPVTTLRTDKEGYTNISRNVIQAVEWQNVPITGSATTASNHKTRGRIPQIAREKRTDAGKGVPRTGPIVLPFVQHLYGRGQGAYCGDSTIIPVIGEVGLTVGSYVVINDFDADLGIAKVKKISDVFGTDPLFLEDSGGGIIQSVIEDSARRTYLGIDSENTDCIYTLQFFGMGRALVKSGTSPSPEARSKLYIETDGVGLTAVENDYYRAINLGKPLTPEISGYTNNLVFLVQQGGTAVDTWAFGVKSMTAGVDAVPAKVIIREGPLLRGVRTEIIVPETELSITAQGQIVFVRAGIGTTTTGELGVANASNFPKSGSATYVVALQSFNWSETTVGGVTTKNITKLITYHRGAVQIDSAYG